MDTLCIHFTTDRSKGYLCVCACVGTLVYVYVYVRLCLCKSYLVFPSFLSRGHSGLTLSVQVGLGVVALRAPGSAGVHLGCFPPNGSFRYKFPVRRHCLSGIWWRRLIWCALGLFGVGSVTIMG